MEQNDDYFLYQYDEKIMLKLFLADEASLNERLFHTAGAEEFTHAFLKEFPDINFEKTTGDEDIFKTLKI